MSIVKKKLKSCYSQLPNALITDKTISARAYRVMTYLLSLPDGWEFNNTDVCNKLGISEEMISKYWKELIQTGWITRYNRKRINGKYADYEYELHDDPFTQPTGELQDLEITTQLKCQSGETSHITNTNSCTNTNGTINTDINNKKNKPKEKITPEYEKLKQVIKVFKHFGMKYRSVEENILDTSDACDIHNMRSTLNELTLKELKAVIKYKVSLFDVLNHTRSHVKQLLNT